MIAPFAVGANSSETLDQFLKSTQFPSGFSAKDCETLLLTDAVAALPSPAQFRKLSLEKKILAIHRLSYRNFEDLGTAVASRNPVTPDLPAWASSVAQLLRILSEEPAKKLQPFSVELWAISLELAHLNAFSSKLSEQDLFGIILFQKKITSLRAPGKKEFHAGMLWNLAHSNLVALLSGRMKTVDPVKGFRDLLEAAQKTMDIAIDNGAPHFLPMTSSYALNAAISSFDRVKPGDRSSYVRSVEAFFYGYIALLEDQLRQETEDLSPTQATVLSVRALFDVGEIKSIESFPESIPLFWICSLSAPARAGES